MAQIGDSDGIMSMKKALCAPGILNKSRSKGMEVSYTRIGGGPITNNTQSSFAPEEINYLQSLKFKLKIPVLNQPDLKILIGFKHQPETIFFDDPSLIKANSVFKDVHATRLKSSGLGIYAMKSINATQYTGIQFKINYNGDYDQLINFDNQYRDINISWAYGYKLDEDFEWGYGVTFSSNFRRTLALPFLFYNRNFNEKWGVESVFPAYIDMRYNLNKKTILLGGYKFNSNNYSIDKSRVGTTAPINYHMNHAELQFGVSVERQLVPWVWMNARGGFQYNLNTRLESQVPEFDSFEVRPQHAPYFSIGLFISPPDQMR
jgi:hypothetical protein